MGGFGPWPGQPSTGGGGGGFFSAIYDAGVADAPDVDNLMTGTLQQFFINLGATPPPFPPTNPAHFPEGALFVGENPADTGVGADSKPLWRMRRWFSTFPSVGDQIWHETRYDLFAGGVNQISGGDRNLHTVIDQFENRLTFAIHDWQLTRPGLNAPGYTPIYLDNAPVSYQEFQLLDALGGGNSNNWQFNSDGSQFRRVLIPNVIGPGGGPAGPWNYVADAMAIWSRNGGTPLNGSRLYYDAVTVGTFGAVDDSVGQMIVAQAAVVDDTNLGSGQAAGHGETWIRSTLGGPLVLVASWFDDLVDIPVEVIGHTGAVWIGGLTVDGTTSTTGDINAGGDLNAGSGHVAAGTFVQAGGQVKPFGADGAPLWGEATAVDFLAAPGTTYAVSLPLAAGKSLVSLVCMVVFDTITGVAAGNLNISLGNANGPGGAPLANAITTGNIAAAAINAGSGLTPYRITFSGNSGPLPDMSATPISVRINANPTGVTVLNGRVFLSALYV